MHHVELRRGDQTAFVLTVDGLAPSGDDGVGVNSRAASAQ
jgi:hypothetical protein